ncbi:unnamed protein product [Heligmosomoides polygyrus]|uniref:Secreted protein n=1 Tax=Heligmosomoides polygyrus TaxID=6339 RepID=A0A183GFT9_HELPZ|nr:unnamed protein product [Heligmosomoides polygyrus]
MPLVLLLQYSKFLYLHVASAPPASCHSFYAVRLAKAYSLYTIASGLSTNLHHCICHVHKLLTVYAGQHDVDLPGQHQALLPLRAQALQALQGFFGASMSSGF